MGAVERRHVVLLPLVANAGVVEMAIGNTGRANVHTLGEAGATSQGCEDVVSYGLGLRDEDPELAVGRSRMPALCPTRLVRGEQLYGRTVQQVRIVPVVQLPYLLVKYPVDPVE